jgi:hypothetical protein
MKRGIVLLMVALGLAGCASIQTAQTRSMEQMLSDAGFQMKAADTPEKLARLQTLPPRKVVLRPRDGVPHYVYADPTVCKCLYAGTEQQYQDFKKLRRAEEIAQQNALATAQFADPFYPDFWVPWR